MVRSSVFFICIVCIVLVSAAMERYLASPYTPPYNHSTVGGHSLFSVTIPSSLGVI